MPEDSSIKCETFADILSICLNRAGASRAQDSTISYFKGSINEHHDLIVSERNWHWRSFERSIVIDRAVSTGTAAVTEDSRIVTFTGITVTSEFLDRTFRFNNQADLYRAIGYKASSNQIYLDAPYTGSTDATAEYKMYQYEFALPPDCDNIKVLSVDNSYTDDNGEILPVSEPEFIRMLSTWSGAAGMPLWYNRTGKMHSNANGIAPLGEMILGYDFLGRDLEDQEKYDKIKFFPIEPDRKRIIHLSYSQDSRQMVNDDDKPMIPRRDRWVLVHYAMSDWYADKKNFIMSQRAKARGDEIMRRLRAEYKKSETSPKFIMNANRYKRKHRIRSRREEFYAARDLEGTS